MIGVPGVATIEGGLSDRLGRLRSELGSLLSYLEPDHLHGRDACRMAEQFAEIERLGAAGKGLCARRVEATAAWEGTERSAAAWLAGVSGTSVGQAAGLLEAAAAVADQPEVEQAWRAGELSGAQTAEIAGAVATDPNSAARLVDTARKGNFAGLRDDCRKARAAGSASDEQAAYRRIHAGRYVRTWTDPDGSGRVAGKFTPDALAVLRSVLTPFQDAAFDAARATGQLERPQCYAADGLIDMAKAAATPDPGSSDSGPRSPVQVIARIDHAALIRGWRESGETSEIDGIGPVPVATINEMLGDAFLSAVVSDGRDIRSLVHIGRKVTNHQRTALIARDPHCVVPGCFSRWNLEIDHVEGWAKTHETSLDSLARLCTYHHHMKTYAGYTLAGRPGTWTWTPPDHGPDPFPDEPYTSDPDPPP